MSIRNCFRRGRTIINGLVLCFYLSKTMFYQQGGLPPLDSVSVMDLFKGFQPITEYINYYYYYQYEVTNQNHSKLIARILIRACGLEKFSKNS